MTVPVAQASERNLDSVSEAKPMAARLIALLDTLTWWRIVLLSSAAAVVVGGWVFAALPARYTASATLLVSHRPDVIASFTQSGEVPLGGGEVLPGLEQHGSAQARGGAHRLLEVVLAEKAQRV